SDAFVLPQPLVILLSGLSNATHVHVVFVIRQFDDTRYRVRGGPLSSLPSRLTVLLSERFYCAKDLRWKALCRQLLERYWANYNHVLSSCHKSSVQTGHSQYNWERMQNVRLTRLVELSGVCRGGNLDSKLKC